MNENIEKLKDLIINSGLEEKQKELWMNFINSMSEIELSAMWDLFTEEPKALHFLTKNLEAKIKAVINNDKDAIERMVQEEAEYLKSLDS